ncbi:MAG: TetR/AcrR family transcriptional regulator [Polyangiaceae bacterium]|nr:TetR/AcrR family transcriptional regulator [Polyangiaceae bacterium]
MNVPSENEPARQHASETSRTRGRPRVGDKRAQVLAAALELFAERGYHGTAVPEVAQKAGVGTGTLYRFFPTKEALVNVVYREAKARLGAVLLTGLDQEPPGKTWFMALWSRLASFAKSEPLAFQFLEMQDHVPYLDEQSRQIELQILAPLWLKGQNFTRQNAESSLPVDVAIALVWGAFVGLIKAERLGYITITDASLAAAGDACFRIVGSESVSKPAVRPSRSRSGRPTTV